MSDLTSGLAEALLQEGVQFAFGITGSGASLALITELEQGGVRYFDVPHEAAGAIMAGTVARWTGRPAVSVSIKGPGLANMFPGIAHNFFESNPAISVSEAYAPSVTLARQHKRMDQRTLLRPFVKAIAGATAASDELRGHIRAAAAEMPGPVHFELAPDITSDALPTVVPSARADDSFSSLIQRIQAASRPAVVVGSLAMRRSWGAKVATLQVPVFTTAAAKGLIDERGDFAAGVYTGDGKAQSPEARVLPDADLVVCVGVRDQEILSPWMRSVEVVGIDEIDGARSFPFSWYHRTATSEDVSHVLATLSTRQWGAEAICRARKELFAGLAAQPWQPYHCFQAMQARAAEQTLVTDTGSFCTIAEHVWLASPNAPYLGSSNGRYMGVSLPSAVAVAVCDRERPVFCAVGDGGMRTYPAMLKLAVEENLGLCIVLMRDSQYGSIACAAPPGHSLRAVRIAQPSWASTVAGMGIPAAQANTPVEFQRAIEDWDGRSPRFIEAVFDPEAYQSITAGIR